MDVPDNNMWKLKKKENERIKIEYPMNLRKRSNSDV